jgi:capsular polysaccharide biosynthesis protein
VIAGGIALAISLALPKTWETEAIVLVGSLYPTSPDEIFSNQANARTYAGLATSDNVMRSVIAATGIDATPTELADAITATAPTDLPFVEIRASGPTPSDAKTVADAVAAEIILLAVPTSSPEASPSPVASPAASPAASAAPSPEASPTPGVESAAFLFQEAPLPIAPSSPMVALNTAVAGALGLLLGAALGWLFGTRTAEL